VWMTNCNEWDLNTVNKLSLHLKCEGFRLPDGFDFFLNVFVFQIRSDKENHTRVTYSITGPGVDEPPLGVFGVDAKTGFVKVYSPSLDRETVPFYHVSAL